MVWYVFFFLGGGAAVWFGEGKEGGQVLGALRIISQPSRICIFHQPRLLEPGKPEEEEPAGQPPEAHSPFPHKSPSEPHNSPGALPCLSPSLAPHIPLPPRELKCPLLPSRGGQDHHIPLFSGEMKGLEFRASGRGGEG